MDWQARSGRDGTGMYGKESQARLGAARSCVVRLGIAGKARCDIAGQGAEGLGIAGTAGYGWATHGKARQCKALQEWRGRVRRQSARSGEKSQAGRGSFRRSMAWHRRLGKARCGKER